MNFWSYFFSVLAGIVAGTGITLFVHWILNRLAVKRDLKNLVYEINFNLGRIDELEKELEKYRNALNAKTLKSYFPNLTMSRVITTTLFKMFVNASIYRFLDHEDILKLQLFTVNISGPQEATLIAQIVFNKEHFYLAFEEKNIREKADAEMRGWEKLFADSKKDLVSIKGKLEKKLGKKK
jgi:hypothetical protein